MGPAQGGSSSGGNNGLTTSLFKWEPPLRQEDNSVKITEIQEASAHPFTGALTEQKTAPTVLCQDGQVYMTTAKIYNEKIVQDVYRCAMEVPITVTQRELLSLAPELRAQVADATVKCQITREVAQTLLEDAQEPAEEETYQEEPQLSHMPATFATATRRLEQSSATSLNTIHPVQDLQEEVEVAAESNALHAILPLVDGKEWVEAILDPRCQVAVMSEEVCNALALPYDPDVRLNMVSANGGVDQSLRVGRNIAFLVGDITVYLQVHILQLPTYNILLGCPFNILTQSVV